MAALAIVALCVLAAIAYGIAHDMVTAHLCVEYFTIGHPPVFRTEDPVLLALGWGVIATWWMGLLLGVPLATAARAGRRPKRTAPELVRPIAKLLVVMATCAAIAGFVGWLLARDGRIVLVGGLAARVPADRHALYLADLWAHLTSYAVGFVGGILLAVRTWRGRR